METSLFLAKVVGLSLAISTLAIIVRHKMFKEVIELLEQYYHLYNGYTKELQQKTITKQKKISRQIEEMLRESKGSDSLLLSYLSRIQLRIIEMLPSTFGLHSDKFLLRFTN